jgi:hypothetical protein
MSVTLTADGVIQLVGRCPSDDAGPLLEHLLAHPGAAVDWRGCEWAHTAVVQVLLAGRRKVIGPSKDRFLARWVEPMLGPG